jgi:restriction system protein
MRAIITVRELLDTVIEEVAIKTGILLTDHNVKTILKSSDMKNWLGVFTMHPDETLGIRPEFVEDAIRVLRYALGNLPDASHGAVHAIKIYKEIQELGVEDLSPVSAALSEILHSGKYKILGEEAAKEISEKAGVPMIVGVKVLLVLAEMMDRGMNPLLRVESMQWDGIVPLSKLFNGELIPENPDEYLDQRFLDYLSANNETIDKIYWRNFERLCAEFFKRVGYVVELGAGSKDGGIDIRIWPDVESHSGPPLLLIQCKRYKKGELVTVEYVKALWSDVVFEKADRGLLITTSHVAPGGKKICRVRKWPLDTIEYDKVKVMVNSLWRHAWKGRGKTKGVGIYLGAPPVVRFGRGFKEKLKL